MTFFSRLFKTDDTYLLPNFFVLESYLKGLSYEIDFENFDENWQILASIRAAAGFLIFRKHLWFLIEIKHLFPVNAKSTPISYVVRLILSLNSRQAYWIWILVMSAFSKENWGLKLSLRCRQIVIAHRQIPLGVLLA